VATVDVASSPFPVILRRALEHIHEPDWLAAHSPLAAPSFLGVQAAGFTGPDGPDPGRALRAALFAAADSLWEGGPPPTRDALMTAVEEARQLQGNRGDEYAYLLLELRYFRRYFSPDDYPTESADMPIFLLVSQTRFFVHLQQAIDRLGEVLLARLRPGTRLETPGKPTVFVGRAAEQSQIAAALSAGQSVSLTGPPGVGKTTMGAALSERLPSVPVFWFTFLPSLNDTLPALLFALAQFAHEQSAGVLYTALLANHDRALDTAEALGLLRADLAALPQPPLIVIDEVDLLRTAGGESRSAAHSQLLFFLESLTQMTAVLLIGQRAYVDTPVHVSLAGLEQAHVATMLDAHDAHLPASQVRQVWEQTGGLPRLVLLVVALLRSGEEAGEILRLPLRGDAIPLFHRLWRRLDQKEKELLVALTAFRRPAPGEIWSEHQSACQSLGERRLLTVSETGQIALHPFFQRLVKRELGPEQREAVHLQAGHIRAARGEYTAAAHHYSEAGEAARAVEIWFPQRENEIRRGQAGAALAVFRAISASRLDAPVARRLKVIQNQLYLMAGETNLVRDNVRSISWEMDDQLSAVAYSQAAVASYALGDVGGALREYGESLAIQTALLRNLVETRVSRAQIYLDERSLVEARQEVTQAAQQVVYLESRIAFNEKRYDVALERLSVAEELARQVGDQRHLAHIARTRAEMLGELGRVDEATQAAAEATDHYVRIGDQLSSAYMRVVLGGIYVNARRFEEAIPPTLEGLAFLEKTGQTQWMVQPLAQLAEAYLETGQIDMAIGYAERVLASEMTLYQPYAFYTLGLAAQRQGRLVDAAALFDEGLRAARDNSDPFIEAYLLRNIGRLHWAQGEQAAARDVLNQALALFRKMGIAHEVPATEKDVAGLG
jgi:tetratricopeptide (TPR) repeat protein